uniref:F-box only protein 5 isoform X2 n=1 Tax=Jaculus jaculus TaxID=51337 RepID=UPI001E1AF87D|nr:F-box only protein 5 isoform X2 [Jaculus jaculus]
MTVRGTTGTRFLGRIPERTICGFVKKGAGCKEEHSILSVKMKCDFNCNPVRTELKVAKSEDSGRQDSHSPACSEGACKDCFKCHERCLGSPILSPPMVELETQSHSLSNKENQCVQQTPGGLNESELEVSRLHEDSGYASFTLQSGLSDHEAGSPVPDEGFRSCPRSCLPRPQSTPQYPNKHLLPALHFEKVVCSTLKKNAKRNPKVDREMLKEVMSSGNFRLQNLIGRKMGLEHLDILSELFRRGFRHLLANILTRLSDMDLINLSKVSRVWKKILEDDKSAFQLYSKAIQRRVFESSKISLHASTREYAMIRTALASVQKSTAWAPPRKDALAKSSNQRDPKNSTHSRHNEFFEVAKTLKNNESLKSCIRCNSPAKYDSYLHRAVCKREGCGFDYCTRCLCAYHSTKDCANGKLLKASCKAGPLPGTRRSKKNLQRL